MFRRQAVQAEPTGVKSAILRWLGVPLSLTNTEFWGAWTESNGRQISADSALAISTVWACVRLISQTIATLPLNLYERGLERRVADTHALHTLIRAQPNKNTTAVVFWEAVVASMLLRGNAFVEIRRIAGTVRGLLFLDPARVQMKQVAGVRSWYYRELDATMREIRRDDLMIIPAFTTDGLLGLSPVAYGAQVFSSAAAANDAASKTFANGMRASGFLTTEATLKPEQREALRASLKTFANGSEVGGTMVLEGGMSYTPLSIHPDDAQLLQTRAFNVEEVCRWFGVPPHMVAHTTGSTSWGTGLEQQTAGFLKFALAPWLKRIEQAIRKDLLTEQERGRYYAEFVLEGLLRADSAARSQFYATAAQNGWMTRNEFRRLENLPPVSGGDELTVQVNLLPVDLLGASRPDAIKEMRRLLGLHEDTPPKP